MLILKRIFPILLFFTITSCLKLSKSSESKEQKLQVSDPSIVKISRFEEVQTIRSKETFKTVYVDSRSPVNPRYLIKENELLPKMHKFEIINFDSILVLSYPYKYGHQARIYPKSTFKMLGASNILLLDTIQDIIVVYSDNTQCEVLAITGNGKIKRYSYSNTPIVSKLKYIPYRLVVKSISEADLIIKNNYTDETFALPRIE